MSFHKSFALILLTALVACSKPEASIDSEKNNLDEFKTFQVDVGAPPIPMSAMIDGVEVLGFEETEASLLSSIFNISIFEDQLVFSSGKKGEIFVYSQTGQFVRKFSHKGDGPEEYSDLKTVWMKADTILVFNHGKSKVLFYGMDGGFRKAVRFDVSATHVSSAGDDFVMENSYLPLKDTLQHRLMVHDDEGKRKGLHIPYHKALTIPIYSNVQAFKPYGNQLAFQPAYHDTVYRINGSEVRPFYAIDFGDRYFWADEDVYKEPERAMSLIYEREQVWWFNSYPGTDQIMINFDAAGRNLFRGVIDRQTGVYQRLDIRRTPEDNFMLFMSQAEDDRFLFTLPSDELAEFLEKVGKEKVSFKPGWDLKRIESSENPVLLWVRFKGAT